MNERDQAMQLAATEYERFIALVRQLDDANWRAVTDCPAWDVRALVAHVCGGAEGLASVREQIHQQRAAKRRPETLVDALGEVQIADRVSCTPGDLIARLERAAPRSVRARRRVPNFVRRRTITFEAPSGAETVSLGELQDVIYTRDTWMHRVDIARATGRALTLTGEHDAALVAGVVEDWARRHGKAFSLTLTGPAGGVFLEGEGGEEYELDAVEFCRILSGRASGTGLLTTEVVF